MKQAKQRYLQQKSNAQQRGIEFCLSFEQWYDIWIQSGHWAQRGRGKNHYVMSRYGDQGPYSIDNVFIQLQTSNSAQIKRDYFPLSLDIKQKMRSAKLGKPQSKICCLRCRTILSTNMRFRHYAICP